MYIHPLLYIFNFHVVSCTRQNFNFVQDLVPSKFADTFCELINENCPQTGWKEAGGKVWPPPTQDLTPRDFLFGDVQNNITTMRKFNTQNILSKSGE